MKIKRMRLEDYLEKFQEQKYQLIQNNHAFNELCRYHKAITNGAQQGKRRIFEYLKLNFMRKFFSEI